MKKALAMYIMEGPSLVSLLMIEAEQVFCLPG
jgi:hypothetical protein